MSMSEPARISTTAFPGRPPRWRTPPALTAPRGRLVIDHDEIGSGYGAPTGACREALDLAARTEGLVLDPVYSGKALAALIRRARSRPAGLDRPAVVFLHTGGYPALFAERYASWIAPE